MTHRKFEIPEFPPRKTAGSSSLRAQSGDATQVAKGMPATSPDSRPVTLPELATLVNVEYRTLHTWVQRGLLRPSVRRSGGTGTANLFSAADAVEARVLADLRRAGLSMEGLERVSGFTHEQRVALLTLLSVKPGQGT